MAAGNHRGFNGTFQHGAAVLPAGADSGNNPGSELHVPEIESRLGREVVEVDAFLELFGDMKVASVVTVLIAAAFLYKLYRQAKSHMIEKFKEEMEKNQKVQEVLDQAKQYPKWHQQSIEIQEKFSSDIAEIKADQLKNSKRLDEMEEQNRRRERNKLRNSLLQSYRYFTNREKNPMQAWSEMEADAFWKMFGDYQDAGGNGHIHTEVQPSMRKLEVIPMEEPDRVAELMQSRR